MCVNNFFNNNVALNFGYFEQGDGPIGKRLLVADILDWIPAIGSLIAGVIRIATLIQYREKFQTSKYKNSIIATQIMRAGVEILGLGILMALADAFFYVGRSCTKDSIDSDFSNTDSITES